MALFHVLLAAALVDGVALDAGDELCESCGADSAFLQMQLSTELSTEKISKPESKYWYPTKAHDQHRTGQSSATGMFPLPGKLAWEYKSPGHSALAMDDKLNTYFGSQEGKIFSFDKDGAMRWEANGTADWCQNPVLFSGTLYIYCLDGSALALDMMTGNRLWQTKVCEALPTDVATMGVTDDYIFMPSGVLPDWVPTGPFLDPIKVGSPALAMLRRVDGEVLWKFDFGANDSQQEFLPCMLSDSVVFTSQNGAVYRLRNEDGHVMWKTHMDPEWYTVAQVSCTEDGHVLVGTNSNGPLDNSDGPGSIQVLDVDTGKMLRKISLPFSTSTPVAVGQIQGHAGTAIIAAMGQPSKFPNITTLNHTLWAIDANTGKMIWSFQTPFATERGVRGSTLKDMCWPQSWSTPIISKDGTVYINWTYGGITYALRDSNKDGVCDLNDPEEVSSFDFGIGQYGGPALAPGMLVVRTCHGPRALRVPEV